MSIRRELADQLEYLFNDDRLLQLALTHRSRSADNNERLEFLGDSILNFVIAETLFERFPDAPEGVLSRLRAGLVRKETLADVARRLNLGAHFRLGSGELKSGGFNRDSILADGFEAVVGAIYKDGGIQEARRFVLNQLCVQLQQANPAAVRKDPKSELQEFLQKYAFDLPDYHVVETYGEPHCQHFVVECTIESIPEKFRGEGASRRNAEQDAAAKAYRYLTTAHG